MTLSSTRARLWRYNFRILIGGGYWVIVLPIAASQIVTLWMMALAGDFNQSMGVQIAELMTPILGAFLVAHSMAPEYRSGTGTVLACKPVSLHRVVTMRVGIALLAAFFLSLVTLFVCSVGLRPIELRAPLLAALPPLWFLSMLALTAATLFRNALAGFAVAAGVWVLDLVLGYGVNPFLSARGLQASLDKDPLSEMWLYGKAILLIGGTVLLMAHSRMLPRICRPPEHRDINRILAVVGAVALLYVSTGAAAAVFYAYTHRGALVASDVQWLRRQMRMYGPLPVAALFGPAFRAYVADIPTGEGAQPARESRILQLEAALSRWPRSIWADGMSYALGIEREGAAPSEAIADFMAVADRFGDSPFAPKALLRIVRADAERASQAQKLTAARRLLAEYAQTAEAGKAAEYMAEIYPEAVKPDEMLAAVEIGFRVGPRYLQPQWLAFRAGVLRDQSRVPEAIEAAREARKLGQQLQQEGLRGSDAFSDLRMNQARIAAAIQMADTLLKELGAQP